LNNLYDRQIYLWQIMYELDEDGEPMLDFLDEWNSEELNDFVDQEKEFINAGFEIENYNIF
jgi:hypothetical protein